MDEQTLVTCTVTKEEFEQYREGIISAVKIISQEGESTENNYYPLITTLCDLLQKFT